MVLSTGHTGPAVATHVEGEPECRVDPVGPIPFPGAVITHCPPEGVNPVLHPCVQVTRPIGHIELPSVAGSHWAIGGGQTYPVGATQVGGVPGVKVDPAGHTWFNGAVSEHCPFASVHPVLHPCGHPLVATEVPLVQYCPLSDCAVGVTGAACATQSRVALGHSTIPLSFSGSGP